ncbi:MAG: tetratricopeptide repeat protein [Chitinophagaceae bacterium]|jgi:tetratricopeptide (TPR) repeat protein|nr:tetratricopeptide repeat protein [Chitinophagaceae bacterium]
MKKLVFLLVGFVFSTALMAQVATSPLAEGVKMLNYEKNKSALNFFKEAYDKNPADGETSFWYGQAMLAQNYNGISTPESIQKAKELYQKSLQAKGSDAWLLVGMSHIQSLEGADANAVKQNLEVAITSTLNTKGKYKGKPSQDIINAIGYVFAELPISIGDHRYAIDKLKETISAYDVVNSSLYVNLGINYLKLGGGENGGDAVTAFQNAINADPKNAYAYYRIGKVYQTQNNKESLDEYFNKAIAADPAIAPVYFSLYTYYAEVSTSIAKTNLDLFLQYADKDPIFEYFSADYLFRSGQFDLSLEKAKAMEAAGSLSIFPGLAVLLAKNYDKKGDTVLAKSYIEPYITNTTPDKLINTDYELAVKILSKFSGSQASLVAILEKAIAADTVKANKLKYYKLGYEMLEKSNMYTDELKWYANYSALRGVKDEVYYYKTTSIAINAKEGAIASSTAKEYVAAFPEKPNGYSMNVRAAKLLDTANNLGILFEAVNTQNEFLLKDVTKNKQTLINNYYTLIGYYNETKGYENAVLMCDKVLELVPEDPTTLQAKALFVKNIEIIKKMQNSKGGLPAPPIDKPAVDTTQIKKG